MCSREIIAAVYDVLAEGLESSPEAYAAAIESSIAALREELLEMRIVISLREDAEEAAAEVVAVYS